MVEQRLSRLDAVFHALSDPTRRNMLRALSLGDRSIGELAAPFHMSFAGASKHVRVMERAGLVGRSVRGRTHMCRLRASSLAEAHAWLAFFERFWNQQLDALDSVLKVTPTAEDKAQSQTESEKKGTY